MKKFIFVLFLVIFSSVSQGHITHYKKIDKIEMAILRNNEVIGYNIYLFNRKGNTTIVSNQFKFEVKLLGAIVFEVEGYGEEKYLKDNLVSYQSKTLQNNKEKFVNLNFNKQTKKFDIEGSSYTGDASLKNIIGNWWSHKILQAESQISPISGSIKEQIVTFIDKENITINEKRYETDRFKLTSKDLKLPDNKKLNFDIWLDKKTSMIVKVTYERMGNWEYRLVNFE